MQGSGLRQCTGISAAPGPSEVVWRQKKATHAYWGSDSRYWPPHPLRQETRNRGMPLSPVVRSCRRRRDPQSPSTRYDRELFKADVVLKLTQQCIRQTLCAAGTSLKIKRVEHKKRPQVQEAWRWSSVFPEKFAHTWLHRRTPRKAQPLSALHRKKK